MPASLTAKMDPHDPAPNVYGLECPEHPTAARYGLGQRHATNAVAKHNRDLHGPQEFNISMLADLVLDACREEGNDDALTLWRALLGHPSAAEAKEKAHQYAAAGNVVAHVAPF